MRRRRHTGSHLVQHDPVSPLRKLESGLATRQAATYDDDLRHWPGLGLQAQPGLGPTAPSGTDSWPHATHLKKSPLRFEVF